MWNPFKNKKDNMADSKPNPSDHLDNENWWLFKNRDIKPLWRTNDNEISCPGDDCPVECDNRCPIWINTMVLNLFLINEYEKAIELGNNGLEIAPDYVELINNVASCYGAINNHVKASEYFQRAINIRPDYQKAIQGLESANMHIQKARIEEDAKYANLPKERRELILRLKEIAEDDSEYEMSEGAMCYSMAPCPELNFECDICDCKLSTRMYKGTYNSIYKTVDEMKSLGYDVKIEDLCVDCMIQKVESKKYTCDFNLFGTVIDVSTHWDKNYKNRIKDDISEEEIKMRLRSQKGTYPHICFYFRTNSNEKYHMIQENNEYCYEALLNFLKNKRSYEGGFGRTHLLRNEIDTIERMTGISFN